MKGEGQQVFICRINSKTKMKSKDGRPLGTRRPPPPFSVLAFLALLCCSAVSSSAEDTRKVTSSSKDVESQNELNPGGIERLT